MRLTLLVVSLLAFVACTKKRDESFVQGQGKDLLLISDYDGKEFAVETLEKIVDFKENPTVTKSEIVTHSKDSDVSLMGAVKVITKADLLGDVPFIALPNKKTEYKIKYVITNDFLVVMKVADKKHIHPKEIPGSIEQAGGLIGVPLVGYKLRGLLNTENVDQNGSKSNKLIEMSVTDKNQAKYFKIDKNDRTIYKFQDKMDLFTKNYFIGEDGKSEWYFAQTIIAAGGRNSDYTGWVLAQQDNDLNALSKVRFAFNRNEMRAVSVNTDSRMNVHDEINQTILVKFPIDWKEYRATPIGAKSFGMTEEENTSIDWEKRKYVKVDFASASTISISSPKFRFVDLEVDTNYFSFTLYDADNNLRIKHSFLRDAGRKKYIAKRMLKEDFEKFGFFDTQKNEINNYEKYRQEDYGKNLFINRFNVAIGEIQFHFTEGSDEKLIPAAAKAADEWSAAFNKAGVPLKIVAVTDKDKRVRLGDIRYNQINLIRSANESNLFGYGPSITDPRTGEIISATTNMHITSILSALVSHIRDYMLFKSGQTKKLSVFVQPAPLSEKIALKGEKVAMLAEDFSQVNASRLLKKFPVVGLNGQIQLKDIEVVRETENKASKNNPLSRPKNWGREFDIGLTGKNLNKEIDQMCPELEPALKALELDKKEEKENELVIACAEKLLPNKMFGTLLHEMGHNFGLRHNFYGSVDAKNFLSKAETGTDEQVQSSSVMEYPSFGEDRLTKVGRYDVAAIRYGYGDAVEIADGSIVKLKDTNRSIQENIGSAQLKNYMFCTDDDVAVGTDPMCARHDAGTTPDAVVQNLINEYNASISDYNYRLGRQRKIDPMRLTNYRIQRFWIPLKRMYDEWRFRLNDHLGIGNEYLENFDAVSLKNKIREKTSNCNENVDINSADCQFKYYEKAAESVFNFTHQMSTLPPKYCIGSRNNKIATVEFADVRKIIVALKKYVPKDCLDKEVVAYIKERNGFEPVQESGYELEDVRLDMKVKMSGKYDWFGNPIPEPPDVIGLMPEKMIAGEVLTVRTTLSMSSQEKTFRPNFLDEPRFRESVLAFMTDRISKGFVADRLVKNDNRVSGVFIEKFKYEKRFIDNLVYNVLDGLTIPDKSFATTQRKKKFAVKLTDRKENLDKAFKKVLSADGTNYFITMDSDSTEAIKLLEKLETLPQRIEAAVPVTSQTFVGLNEMAKKLLPASGNITDTKNFAIFLHQILDDEFSIESMSVKTYIRPKELKEQDKYRVHWKKVLAKEISKFRAIMVTVLEDRDTSAAQRNWDIFYEASGKNIFDELVKENKDYVLNQSIVSDTSQKYQEAHAKKTVTSSNDDTFEFDELQTQYELIIDTLRRMTY